ncbi:hypothetical protein G3A_03535 [Bacillus sp. 17376]|nr:hypothetical protein G3A_03535 [Bacillus sp. 17376]
MKVRKQIGIQEDRLKEKLNQLLKSAKIKPFLQEAVISQRNGRYLILSCFCYCIYCKESLFEKGSFSQ